MTKKIVSLILILCLLLGLSACGDDASTTAATNPAQTTAELLFPQTGDLKEPAVSTEHFSFNKGEMVYLYAMSVSDFLTDYYDYISYIGLDPSTSFKKQQSYFGNGSWFDYFMEDALSYAQDYLLFCEAGRAAGIELTEDDRTYIAKQKEILEQEAAYYGWDVDTYLQQLYSTSLTWEYIETCFEKIRLAQKTYSQMVSGIEDTPEQLEAEYQANRKNYDLVDMYAVDFGDGENIPDDVIETARTALAEVKSYDEFYEAVRTFLSATRTTKTIEDAGGLDTYTKKYLTENYVEGHEYSNNEVFTWAFAEDTQEGTVYLVENSTTKAPYAYFLARKPYRDEGVSVDVRHILFCLSAYGGTYGTAEAARAEAEKIYAQWLSEGGSVDRFIELCAQYSEDGTAETGGLYTGVLPGKMVQTFNDWCFDESRKVGDSGIVDTTYGSHIMYFEGSSPIWEQNARSELAHARYDKIWNEQSALTPVTTNDTVLQSINW